MAEHNRLLIGDIVKCASEFDVVVLAQLNDKHSADFTEVMGKVLTSPRLGVLRTAQVLEGLNS